MGDVIDLADEQPNVQGVWRVINPLMNTTYLIRTDQVNAGSSVHTDTHNPGSKGYGGSEFRYKTTTGRIYKVKGPWHSSDGNLYDQTGGEFCTSELHFTKVVLMDEDDNVLYKENDMVLGHWHRGQRIAQQLAVIQDRPIKCFVETDGGSHALTAYPDRRGEHRLSRRKGDNVGKN